MQEECFCHAQHPVCITVTHLILIMLSHVLEFVQILKGNYFPVVTEYIFGLLLY